MSPRKGCIVLLGQKRSSIIYLVITSCKGKPCPCRVRAGPSPASVNSHGRIPERRPRKPEPQERNAPMTVWQADCKDESLVPAEPEGKRQHGVETLDILDSGTSALLDAQVRTDFTAEVAIDAFVEPLQHFGCPASVVLDRDPRW